MERTETAAQSRAKWLADIADPFTATDPELSAISDSLIYGEILSKGSLTDSQKALVILASLTAAQNWDDFPQAVKGALAVGAFPLEIRETLYQCAPYTGTPRAKKAVTLANREFSEANIALPLANAGTVSEATRFKDGLGCVNAVLKTQEKK